jgi:hypothetical protein
LVLLGGTAFAQVGVPNLPLPTPTQTSDVVSGISGSLDGLVSGGGDSTGGDPTTLLDDTPLSNGPADPVTSGLPDLDPIPTPTPTPSLPTLDDVIPPLLKSTLPDGLLPAGLLPGGGSPEGNPSGNAGASVGAGASSGSRTATARVTVGTVFTDPRPAADISAERFKAPDDGGVGARAADLAAPMALPIAAALLGIFGFTMLARGRGSSGVEDDREALGGWSVIHL